MENTKNTLDKFRKFHYFIADIPFEILLVLSTILTITYLYRPLERYLKQAYNNDYEKENV